MVRPTASTCHHAPTGETRRASSQPCPEHWTVPPIGKPKEGVRAAGPRTGAGRVGRCVRHRKPGPAEALAEARREAYDSACEAHELLNGRGAYEQWFGVTVYACMKKELRSAVNHKRRKDRPDRNPAAETTSP